MNKDRAKELLPIITAWANGETIQMVISADDANEYWADIHDEPFFDGGLKFRIKPKIRMIGDCECAAPVNEFADHKALYATSINATELYHEVCVMPPNGYVEMYLSRGLLFTTKEDAIKTSQAILKLLEVN